MSSFASDEQFVSMIRQEPAGAALQEQVTRLLSDRLGELDGVEFGQPWVNPDTQKTIRKRGGTRTDAFGRAVDPPTSRSR